MILVADGGSTKTSWCLIDESGKEFYFETEGYHPFFVNADEISASLAKSIPEYIAIIAHEVQQVFMYSAGGGYSEKTDQILIDGIANVFQNAGVKVETDLLAAARALLGKNSGFAAILGTGTNTCIYDGKDVLQNIESLGFLLGDEGSGSYIGKKIIGDYIRGYMPDTVRDAFFETYQLSPIDLLNKVYEHSVPNRYCASFARFAGDHLNDNPYYYNVVYESFHDFFSNLVKGYSDYQKYSFNCIGSIAFYFKDVLAEVAKEFNMETGNFITDSMKGLVDYHKNS